MKIGLLVAAYDCADTIQECLRPWLALESRLDLDIAIVSTQFKGFAARENEPTIRAMSDVLYKSKALIISNPFPLMEHEARNMPLVYLLEQNCDVIWLLDGDELYTEGDILRIVEHVSKQPLITWWSIPFKNYVFDGTQWIDGFCPPRIFRTQVGRHKMKEFYWDNDANYESIDGKTTFDYKNLSNSRIPKTIAHIKHLTWLHTNGKRKVEYQLEHFGHCSYRWNEDMKRLEMDYEFHKKNNVPVPELLSD